MISESSRYRPDRSVLRTGEAGGGTPGDSLSAEATVSDELLLDRIRSDDEHAFEVIFHRHYTPLCRFVSTFVRSPDIAKEIVQDIFYRIWANRAKLQVQGSFRAYLYGAARNHSINFLRKERNGRHAYETTTLEPWLALGRGSELPDETLLHEELIAAFDAALDSLPEGQRTVVTLRWHHHMSYAEIAETIGVSVRGVETQIGRAIKRLRRSLLKFR